MLYFCREKASHPLQWQGVMTYSRFGIPGLVQRVAVLRYVRLLVLSVLNRCGYACYSLSLIDRLTFHVVKE